MKNDERVDEILDIMRKKRDVSVAELSRALYVSQSSVRRSLNVLSEQGYLRRTHGGAVLLDNDSCEIPFSLRESENTGAKARIAAAAAALVEDEDILIMDSSSTVAKMVPFLAVKNGLTVITNGAKTALELGELRKFKVYCTGGLLRQNSLSYIGGSAEAAIGRFYAGKCFFSARAASESAVSDISVEEAELRREMIAHSVCSVLLMESSKLASLSFSVICGIKDIDILITEKDTGCLPPAARLIIAPPLTGR